MHVRSAIVAVLLLVSSAAGGSWLLHRDDAAAEGGPSRAPALAEQLRYIGRDVSTGLPTPIDDRFIAEVEFSYERYGKDETAAEPPPPLTGLDVVGVAAPAIAVDARVGRYGLDAFGRLDVPQDGTTVGWNPAYSALPGQGGATFLAGHFTYGGFPAVFSRLAELREGDVVTVALSDGSAYRYRVTSVADYHLATIDMGALLAGREGMESITLMTCSGPAIEGEYDSRTVVLAERLD